MNMKWDLLFDNQHSGWFQSKLYSGSWDEADYEVTVTKLESSVSRSWLDKYFNRESNIFNCSSQASYCLSRYWRTGKFVAPKESTLPTLTETENKPSKIWK
jgi:hypothetical protein